ncbi:ABC transporter substrate-binding protein [Georgenia sp. SUBG003]|uniref:ABC transporter substrate-binding protein n=1 Tax=Georgenia sp. SUBG003 TaxID=1497974 RepID=UPI003AB82E88
MIIIVAILAWWSSTPWASLHGACTRSHQHAESGTGGSGAGEALLCHCEASDGPVGKGRRPDGAPGGTGSDAPRTWKVWVDEENGRSSGGRSNRRRSGSRSVCAGDRWRFRRRDGRGGRLRPRGRAERLPRRHGFRAGDEIATTRVDRTKEALGEDVEVELIEGDLDIQQFLSAVASGQPPELIYANRDQIGTFASRGAIIPLTRCIEGEGIVTDDFRDPALEQVTFDGEVYGIPEFNSIQVTMANSELLDATDG